MTYVSINTQCTLYGVCVYDGVGGSRNEIGKFVGRTFRNESCHSLIPNLSTVNFGQAKWHMHCRCRKPMNQNRRPKLLCSETNVFDFINNSVYRFIFGFNLLIFRCCQFHFLIFFRFFCFQFLICYQPHNMNNRFFNFSSIFFPFFFRFVSFTFQYTTVKYLLLLLHQN